MRGLLLEGLMYGGKFAFKKSIGLALFLERNLPFFFVVICIWGQFPNTSSPAPGAYIWRDDLTEGFLRFEFGGLTHGGAYFRNFTVFSNVPHLLFTRLKVFSTTLGHNTLYFWPLSATEIRSLVHSRSNDCLRTLLMYKDNFSKWLLFSSTSLVPRPW